MNHRGRLDRLEQRRDAARWCRCGWDRARWEAESLTAMATGAPTPATCAHCGGARIQVQYYDAADGDLRRGLRGQ